MEYVLGNILKKVLEESHYSGKKVDDDLSQKAHKEFIERLDYRKHFFTQTDIKSMDAFKTKMDDELANGNLDSLKFSTALLNKRVSFVEGYVKELLNKPFNFTEKIFFETDPEKRVFSKNEQELKEVWKDTLKYAVLNEISGLEDEQKAYLEKPKDGKKKKKKKNQDKKFKPKTFIQMEKEARSKVKKDYESYFGRIKREKKMVRLSRYYNSIIRIFDPHTTYLQPDDREDFNINISGKLEGIGAVLEVDGAYIKVQRIVPGSASWKQKELQPEDIILKVAQGKAEPVSIVNTDIRDAVKLIRGEKGSQVRLTVKKPDGAIIVVPIIRDVVEIEESYAKSVIIENKQLKKKIGYINLPSFYRDFNPKRGETAKNCTDDVRKEIVDLKSKGIKGLILDLRNNGGGSLEDARLMTGLFIKTGPVVQVRDHENDIVVLEDHDEEVLYTGPMIVMINRFSASASEILAGALQDYHRAIIVGGDHTHGKGTVQTVLNLDSAIPRFFGKAVDPMGALKITIQQFYRVTGSSTQNRGVVPDIIFPDKLSFLKSGERYLDYALPWHQVKPLKYAQWKDTPYNLDVLKKKSHERVGKDNDFTKIQHYVDWMNAQKDKTNKLLTLESYEKEKKEREEKSKEFKIETLNQDLLITHHMKTRDDAEKERVKEFTDNLKKDPYISETIFVMNDMMGKI